MSYRCVPGKARLPFHDFKLFSAVFLMVAVLLLAPSTRSFGQPLPAAMPVSVQKAPDFVLPDLNGKKFRLSDYRGKKPVLLIFGATWCGFCREEIPHFKAIHEVFAKQGLEMVNIDIQESREKVARFASHYELPYRVLLDGDGLVASLYEIQGVPSMVLVDQAGNIVCYQCRRVEPLIDKLLKKK